MQVLVSGNHEKKAHSTAGKTSMFSGFLQGEGDFVRKENKLNETTLTVSLL